MFAKIARPSSTAATIDREVVVGEHHVRCLFRHIGARDPHGDADVRLLQRRRIIHAVARHRDDGSIPPQRLDDAQLVFGGDARVDGDFGNVRARSASGSFSSSAPVMARPSSRDPEFLRRSPRRCAGDRR